MIEYIEREAAYNAIVRNYTVDDQLSDLDAIPAADVVPVRHGRWSVHVIYEHELSYGETGYEPVYKCSACGLTMESYLRYDEPIMPEDADFPRYCPNCGARMSGDKV